MRFKHISSAEEAYKHSREIDQDTGKRNQVMAAPHVDAQVVYVIPEATQPEKDPLKDENLTLEKIAKLINQ